MRAPEEAGGRNTIDHLLRVEELCNRFEDELIAGRRPTIAEFLLALSMDPATVPPEVFAELAKLESEYRTNPGTETGLPASPHTPDTVSAAADTVPPTTTATGVAADRYRLLEEIGEGGQGIVYRAHEPTLGREVAVKVLLDRYRGDPNATRRFLAEAQVTGRLQHPGIPPIFELGTLLDGSPYLAMKLVDGRTFAQVLASVGTSAGESVTIFEQISQAVAFAHSRGIIHRDLKPANVMVGAFGEVQVMDWGLAKKLSDAPPKSDESEPAKTPTDDPNPDWSRPGTVVGTPAFMAPEQARGESGRVDRRSDVFGLGAILCVILTGRPLYVGGDALTTLRLAAAADLSEAFARLDACGADPELVALCRLCLAPDPANRPADAGEVAKAVADLRAAADERLKQAELKRAAAETRASEAVRRRKILYALAGVLLIGAITSTALASWAVVESQTANKERENTAAALDELQKEQDKVVAALGETEQQRSVAEQAKAKAEAATTVATAAKIKADEETAKAKAAAEAERKVAVELRNNQQTLLDIFADVDIRQIKEEGKTVEALLATRLVEAARQLDPEHARDPLEVAKLQDRLGHTLLSLGYPHKSVPIFQSAFETRKKLLRADHEHTLDSMDSLARGYKASGEYKLAIPLYKEALEGYTRKFSEEDRRTLTCMSNLAICLRGDGQVKEALKKFEHVLKLSIKALGEDDRDTIGRVGDLATGYYYDGQYHWALPLYLKAYEKSKEELGEDNPDTLTAMSNLGLGYRAVGHLPKAIEILEAAVRLTHGKLGADHPRTLIARNNLADAYREARRLKDAQKVLEEVVDGFTSRLGPNHPETLTSVNNLASVYAERDQLAEAVKLLEGVLVRAERHLPPLHPITLNTRNNLGEAYRRTGNSKKAIEQFELAVNGFDKVDRRHPTTLTALANLASAHLESGDYERGLQFLHDAFVRHTARYGPTADPTLSVQNGLILAYLQSDKPERALPVLNDLIERFRKHPQINRLAFAQGLALWSLDLLEARQFEAAEKYLREALEVREKHAPNDWTTFNTRAMLGAALLGQKKYAAAEPLLLEGYAGMEKLLPTIPQQGHERLAEATNALIQLYTELGKPNEVKKWRAERARYGPERAPPPHVPKEPRDR